MPAQGRKFVIVGGAGLVGSAVAHALSMEGGADIVICDTLGSSASGKWNNLPAKMDDLWHPDALIANLDKAWREVAGVLIFADAGMANDDADALFETAYHLPRRIWDVCVAKQRPIYWASSAHVYGKGPSNSSRAVEEVAALQPVSAFGRAKKAFDVFAAKQGDGPTAPPVTTGFRLSSVYGAGEGHKGALASLPTRALKQVQAQEAVTLWQSTDPEITDGGQSRDWVHAYDVAGAVRSVVLAEKSGFFDIGTGQVTSALDVARAAGQVAKAQVSIGYISPPNGALTLSPPPADLSALDAAGLSQSFRALAAGLETA